MAGFFVKTLFFVKKGMGRTYIKGLIAGIKLPVKNKKVSFQMKYLKNYVRLQLELWWNVVRKLTG